MKSFAARVVVMAGAATMLVSGPAAAAARTQVTSPWVSFSAFAAPASSQALCGAAAASAAAGVAAQAGTPGCVFPAVDAPVAAPVADAAPILTPAATTGGAIGILPLLVGLAALGGLAALLLSNGEGQTQISVSP